MTVAAWILTSVLVVIITLVVMGAAIRPYVAELVTDRDAWKDRALAAEFQVEASQGNDVKLLDPKDHGLPWSDDPADVWLKGME